MRLVIAAGIVAAVAIVSAVLLFYPVTMTTSGGTVTVVENGGLEGYDQTVVYINDVGLLADIADTAEKKIKGLSVRETMDEGEAMLFLFDVEARYAFHMQGMKFPIDIIWISSDKTVVHIEQNLQPCTPFDCPQYLPDSDALYVLETVAGFSQRHGVTTGTQVEFQLS